MIEFTVVDALLSAVLGEAPPVYIEFSAFAIAIRT